MDFKEFKDIDPNDKNLVDNLYWKIKKEKKTLKEIIS